MLTNRSINLLFTFLFANHVSAQINIRKAYIQEFSQMAVDEMNRSGIPRLYHPGSRYFRER